MPPAKRLKTRSQTSKETKPSIDSDLDNGQEWRAECNGIREINNYALRKNILTDVTFYVGSVKEVFHAHRLILALGSPVFEAMFYGPLAEKGDTVTIPDVEPEGFQHLLKFLYSETTVLKDDMAAIKTAFAAEKYCISCLKKFSENFLCNYEIKPSNVWMLLQNSIYLNLNDLKKKCLTFLKGNAASALQHKSFLEINANTVETVICSNGFAERVTEKKLLQYVMHWAHQNSNHDDKDSFKNILTPLLKYVKFDSFEAKDFVHFLEVKKLGQVLGPDDALAILKHLLQPMLCPLPGWCSKGKRVSPSYSPQKQKDSPIRGLTFRCLLAKNFSRDDQSSSSSKSSSSSGAIVNRISSYSESSSSSEPSTESSSETPESSIADEA